MNEEDGQCVKNMCTTHSGKRHMQSHSSKVLWDFWYHGCMTSLQSDSPEVAACSAIPPSTSSLHPFEKGGFVGGIAPLGVRQ